MESLFYEAFFSKTEPVKLFIHHSQVSNLHVILGNLEHIVSGSTVSFYEAFQLIPVSDHFWFDDLRFNVFEARHHSAKFSHGIALSGRFVYTIDTKPIPEALMSYAMQGEVIFHDLSLHNQQSHTFLEELNNYPKHILERCMFYHLQSEKDHLILDGLNMAYVENNICYEV